MNVLKPWARGLIEGLTITNLITKTIVPSRNRLALIILDSTLEIAFKDFLLHEKKINVDKKSLEFRSKLHKMIKNHTSFDKGVWDRIEFYYELRCGLYHEESAKTISDESIKEFYEIVEFVIDTLFNVASRTYVLSIDDVFPEFEHQEKLDINSFKEIKSKIIVAVKLSKSKNAEEIKENLKKMGVKKEIQIKVINKYIKNYYKHLFYFDNQQGIWILSNSGELEYKELTKDLNNLAV